MTASDEWVELIARMIMIQQRMMELDVTGFWEYHLPRVAADERAVIEAESVIGERLPGDYRAFLLRANGWPAFYQRVDLYGTPELVNLAATPGSRTLGWLEEVVLAQSGVSREQLIPIAASRVNTDLFVVGRAGSPVSGPVIWFAGGEIERFPSFTEYFKSMMEYNLLEVQDLAECR